MKTSKRIAAAVVAIAATAALSGCYVVPIDPRTPPPVYQPGQSPAAAQVPVNVPMTLHAKLYPLNETAGRMGALSATVADTNNGRATFSLVYAGETMQGDATRVAENYPGFGAVHREVYGQGAMPRGQRGIASAAGARGTYVNCEYALSAPSRGTGACVFNNGAKYQLHFGS
jgi:hypothetical protein